MRKLITLGLAAILLFATIGTALSSDDIGTVDSHSSSIKTTKSPSSSTTGGGHKACITDWAWNGEEWVKRPLRIVTLTKKGTYFSYVREPFNGCPTLTMKPKTPGTVANIRPVICLRDNMKSCLFDY